MKPNIVIIVFDAVRAKNLPLYGYHRDTTPFLQSIAEDLAIYENAISSTYWTMPSVASLFTGMYSSGHGLVVDGETLDDRFPVLPEILRNQGYRCAGFGRNVYVSDYSGLNRGFHEFYSTFELDQLKKLASKISKRSLGRLQPPGINNAGKEDDFDNGWKSKTSNFVARLADVAIDSGGRKFVQNFHSWLNRHQDEPFFAYFHFLETHSPYRAPLRNAFQFLNIKDNLKKLFINHDHLKFLSKDYPMTTDDFRILEGAYDNAIRYVDALTGKIIDLLKKKGLYGNTLIVILSDHGDNIGDHDLMFHYWCLYDTLIKIPLLVKFPQQADLHGQIDKVVQNVDILPTILTLLNDKDEKIWGQIQGNDLLDLSEKRRPEGIAVSELIKVFGPDRKHLRTRFERYNRRLCSVRSRNKKFIHSSKGDHECYDLQNDPAETDNLYLRNTAGFEKLMELAARYYQRMDEYYVKNAYKIEGDIDIESIDTEVMENLKSLGYM